MKPNYTGIKKTFSNSNIISTDDLLSFYKSIEPTVKKTTVNWRIYELVRSGQLQRIGRGKYILGNAIKYFPAISAKEIKIGNLIRKEFPFINYCIWNTSILNEFSQHLSTFRFVIVEIEKEALDSVYFSLKESFNSTFKKPSREMVEEFISGQANSIIIKPFVSEAPLEKYKNMPTTTLEKLLVDLYCDKNLFYFLQGNELVNIYKNAFEKYTINQSKLLRYADRRQKKKQIEDFINTIFRQ